MGGVGEVGGDLHDGDVRFGGFDDFAGGFDVGAFESDDEGDFEADGFGGSNDAACDFVALHDSAKDVDEDAFDVGIGEDDLECFCDGFFGCGAADVEEVGGFTSVELDDVHGGHGETGAVDEAADGSVELDVGETEFVGFEFGRVFLSGVEEGLDVLVSEKRVVVEGHFGVDGHDLTIGEVFGGFGGDKGIDLDHVGVFGDKEPGEFHHDGGGLGDLLADEAELEGDGSGFVTLESHEGVDVPADNFFGCFCGDGFDVDTAFRGGDHDRSAGGSVECDGEIEFLVDFDAGGDEDFVDGNAFGTGLVCDEVFAHHGFGGLLGIVGGFDEFDAATFAASAGVDLGFDDGDGGAVLLKLIECIGDGGGGVASDGIGDGDARVFEDLAGLVFVDFHS